MFMQQQHNSADFSLGMKTKMQVIFNDFFFLNKIFDFFSTFLKSELASKLSIHLTLFKQKISVRICFN